MEIKEITLTVPRYTREGGFRFHWYEGFMITTRIAGDGSIVLSANKEGLLSLANHLVNLAQEDVPAPYHIHLDGDSALEGGSVGVVIEKML